MGDEERKRQQRARRLRKEIKELESGAPPKRPPRSPREFIERGTADESDPPANEHEATDPTGNAST